MSGFRPTTAMVKFSGTITINVEIEVSQELIEGVLTDEWRAAFYSKLKKPEDVAYHLAYNAIRNFAVVSDLDGFADRDDTDMKVLSQHWEREDDWEKVP